MQKALLLPCTTSTSRSHPVPSLGITGAAGSGKSTLTYAFNGIIPHCYPGDFYGSVHVCGLDTVEADLTSISRLVGSVCQDIDSQMVSSVVEDEILYGLENFGVPKDQIERRLAASVEAMGIKALRDRTIDSLSGGQKQKVALASIIALEPRVLVLDEPTAELDPVSSVGVFAAQRLRAEEQHNHRGGRAEDSSSPTTPISCSCSTRERSVFATPQKQFSPTLLNCSRSASIARAPRALSTSCATMASTAVLPYVMWKVLATYARRCSHDRVP